MASTVPQFCLAINHPRAPHTTWVIRERGRSLKICPLMFLMSRTADFWTAGLGENTMNLIKSNNKGRENDLRAESYLLNDGVCDVYIIVESPLCLGGWRGLLVVPVLNLLLLVARWLWRIKCSNVWENMKAVSVNLYMYVWCFVSACVIASQKPYLWWAVDFL